MEDVIVAGSGKYGGITVAGGNNVFIHPHCYPYQGSDLPTFVYMILASEIFIWDLNLMG